MSAFIVPLENFKSPGSNKITKELMNPQDPLYILKKGQKGMKMAENRDF